MTQKEIEEKYNKTLEEISKIELTANKSKRLRWRELQKIKKWLEGKKSDETKED